MRGGPWNRIVGSEILGCISIMTRDMALDRLKYKSQGQSWPQIDEVKFQCIMKNSIAWFLSQHLRNAIQWQEAPTSIKLASGISARHASRSLLYGDIKLAIQMMPASAKSFATSPTKTEKMIKNECNSQFSWNNYCLKRTARARKKALELVPIWIMPPKRMQLEIICTLNRYFDIAVYIYT